MSSESPTHPEPEAKQGEPPRVSVIIPVYRGKAFIREAIDSVLAQTFADFELLVVDDGCPESTGDLVKAAYAHDPRVCVLHQPNGGTAAARNQALQGARGELVALLDQDDLWQPSKLETMAALFDDDPGLALAHSGAEFFREGTGEITSVVQPEGEQNFYDLLSWCVICCGTSVMRRQAVLDAGGFDAELGGVDDWDLWIRLAHRGRVRAIPNVLSRIRVHENNQSNDPWPTFVLGMKTLAKNGDLRTDPQARRALRDAKHRLRQDYWVKMCRRASASSRRKDQFCLRLEAIRRNPAFLPNLPARFVRRIAGNFA